MGIYYRAAIVLGLPRKDLEVKFEDLGTFLEENEEFLTVVPAMYDGYTDEEAIVGFILQESDDYQAVELHTDEVFESIPQKVQDFHELTGMWPKVWLSPYCS